MKVALYARVSTVDKNQDPELQLKDLRAYAKARKWTIYREYVDVGQSGGKEHRPELDKLMDAARKRKINTILVWRLDRFGRSLKNLINTLDELRLFDVTFVSYSENLDLSTTTGQLLFHLLGAFAEFERNLTRDRVKAGMANARAKGIVLGRPYRYVNKDKLIELREKGLSVRKIAKELKISKTLVHKSLKKLQAGDPELPSDSVSIISISK